MTGRPRFGPLLDGLVLEGRTTEHAAQAAASAVGARGSARLPVWSLAWVGAAIFMGAMLLVGLSQRSGLIPPAVGGFTIREVLTMSSVILVAPAWLLQRTWLESRLAGWQSPLGYAFAMIAAVLLLERQLATGTWHVPGITYSLALVIIAFRARERGLMAIGIFLLVTSTSLLAYGAHLERIHSSGALFAAGLLALGVRAVVRNRR